MSIHYYRFTRLGAAGRERCAFLERLLVRADPPTVGDHWRAEAFRVIAPAASIPSVAAAALYADRGLVEGSSAFIATPVHYVAETATLRLPGDGILSLSSAEAGALADDFNHVWSDAGVRLLAGRRADLYCVFQHARAAATHDPEELLDRQIESYLPSGADGLRLRQLMSEVEMWLFEHAVNRSRMARGTMPVNALWLWGGGTTLTSLPGAEGWAAGDDPLFRAVAARPESLHGRAASGVIVTAAMPGTAQWDDMELQWLRHSLADLRAGRITRLDLSAGERCFGVRARRNWRPWRRPRPWWESFA